MEAWKPVSNSISRCQFSSGTGKSMYLWRHLQAIPSRLLRTRQRRQGSKRRTQQPRPSHAELVTPPSVVFIGVTIEDNCVRLYTMQTGYSNKCNLPCANDEYQQPLINSNTSGTRPVLADLTVIPLQMCACAGTRHQHIGQWLLPGARPYYKGRPAGIRAHPNAWPGFIKQLRKTRKAKLLDYPMASLCFCHPRF